MDSIILQLAGMRCTACTDQVDRALCAVQGVRATEVGLEPQRAVVTYDHRLTTPDRLREVIHSLGFHVLDWEARDAPHPPHREVAQAGSDRDHVFPDTNPNSQPETDPIQAGERIHLEQLHSVSGEQTEAQRGDRSYWQIDGMHCSSCVARVEQAMNALPGVHDVRVNLATHRASAMLVPDTPPALVTTAITRAGYTAAALAPADPGIRGGTDALQREVKSWRNRAAFACLGLGLLLGCTWLMATGHSKRWILALLATGLMVYAGAPFFASAVRRLRFASANMDTLVALATSAAFISGLIGVIHGTTTMTFSDVGMILAFLSTGRYLEAKARFRASDSLRSLVSLVPIQCRVQDQGNWVEKPTAHVDPGAKILIRPGERIPLDAEVITGTSQVDEAWLTGESIPRDKEPGDRLLAGTVNTIGPLQARVVHTAHETALAKVIELVQSAVESKANVQRLADRVVAWFVPFVLAASMATFACWLAFGSQTNTALQYAVAVLIVACPCALGLATPTAVLVGSALGAEQGILIKDAHSLEIASAISTVVFDKTGTLSAGTPQVIAVEPAAGIGDQQLVAIAATVQRLANHPLADAIVARFGISAAGSFTADSLQLHPGKGVTAECRNSTALMGNEKLFRQFNVEIPATDLGRADRLRQQAQLVFFVGWQNRYWGLIALEDQPRATALDCISQLRKRGLRVVMLTGDNRVTARTMAKKLGIDEVHAEVLPGDKQQLIHEIQGQGHAVAMVGDGINDAPALAAADLGIAIGSGADVSIEAADIVLMRDRLLDVPRAIHLSRATLRTIRQNLAWAFVYNTALLPVAAGLIPSLSLRPAWAAAAMALSSICVVTNSLLLRTR